MRREKLKNLLEIVGMAAIVDSLIFVGLQIRQDQNIAMVESQGTVAAQAKSEFYFPPVLQGHFSPLLHE